MPRVLIEAMSRGLTALGSIIGDIPEQMTAMAKNNTFQAKKFQKELLEQKRYDF